MSPILTTGVGTFPVIGGGGGGNVGAGVNGITIGTYRFQSNSNNFNYTGLTIPAGLTNPGLICVMTRVHSSNDVEAGLALTWGAQAMTLIASTKSGGGGQNNMVFIFGLRNPTSGLQTLNVSSTNVAADNMINCVAFSNVNPASNAAAFPNGSGISAQGAGNVNAVATYSVTSANGHIAVGVFDSGGGQGTVLGTTIFNDAVNGSIVNAAADYVVSSGSPTVVGSGNSNTNLAACDVSN